MALAFREAVESQSLDRMREALAPEVVFRSPVVFKPYEGRDTVMHLLDAVFQVFEDFQYTNELAGERSAGLVFRARVGDREIEGWDYLRLDDAGRVTELVVMVRPMSAMRALAEAMAAKLAA